MKRTRIYRASDLISMLNETNSKNSFSPVFGDTYSASKEKSINKSFYTDARKRMKDYDLDERQNNNMESENDLNKTLLDLKYNSEPSDSYKRRVRSQVHGYTSEDNEKLHNGKNAKDMANSYYRANYDMYSNLSKRHKSMYDNASVERMAGLKSHNIPKDKFKDNNLFTEQKMKCLNFKRITFLNEDDVKKHIPSDYKYDGNRFMMKDSDGNEYTVQCRRDRLCENYIHTDIVNHNCGRKVIYENLKNFDRLVNYNPANTEGGCVEDKGDSLFKKSLDISKTISEAEEKIKKAKRR